MIYLSGAAVTAVYGRLAVVAPWQTTGLAPSVIVGFGFTSTVIGRFALTHNVALLRTVSTALYVAANAAGGTVIVSGDAASGAFTTSANNCPCAVASKSMLY